MALNERLNKFKQQQERPKVAPGFRPANAPFAPVKPLQPVKFSDDTERLQHINSIRKSTVGAQIKLVIVLLEKTRQAFTAEQINEATYVDIRGNKAVFDSLKNNPKVKFEGEHFFYKPTHVLTGRDQLLSLIIKSKDCIAVEEVKDAYPSVLEDFNHLLMMDELALIDSSRELDFICAINFVINSYLVLLISIRTSDVTLLKFSTLYQTSTKFRSEDTAHFNDRRFRITIDNDLKQLYREIELPRDMLDIEKELKKGGEKPLTDTVNRRALAQIHGAASKSKARKKQRGITSKTRITNYHLPELFKNLDT
uniref:TFIIE beta domain-containing protein n=1 Tax=Setaria viridis TaxID=4556 RepID=A0A4U6T9F9_SETVI|nr:hypothetical protein SEVIR_9G525400v2 [Setaria viridis]